MPDINFVNPQINNIDKQEISIQISLNGFSFIIRASETNECLLFKHCEFKNILLTDDLIRKVESIVIKESAFSDSYNFSNANLLFISQKSTLIPEEFFNPEHLKKYFEFSHNLDELDELHYSYLTAAGAYNVFSVPSYLSGLFYPSLSNLKLFHQSTQLINFGFNQNDGFAFKAVIGLNNTFFDLQIFEGNKLLLSNSFQYANSMDFIYFFMYSCNQLKIDLLSTAVYILGDINKNKIIIEELNKQLEHLIQPQIDINFDCKNLTNKDMLKFYNLLLPKSA